MCSKLSIKTPERSVLKHQKLSLNKFILQMDLVLILLTFSIQFPGRIVNFVMDLLYLITAVG